MANVRTSIDTSFRQTRAVAGTRFAVECTALEVDASLAHLKQLAEG